MKTKKQSFCKALFLKIALLTALILGGGNSAWADELTVDKGASGYSNTYTGNIPLAGNLLNDTYIKGEFTILKAKLVSMSGKRITNMSFQLNAATTTWGDAEFKVFLKEVTAAQYGTTVSLIGEAGATTVYTGSLDPTKTSIDITFSTPFDYSGENDLLIGVYCTKLGTNAPIQFKMWRDDYSYYTACITSNKNVLSRYAWIPVTTFTFETPSGTPRPTGFSSSVTAYNSVDLSWTAGGEEDKWQIKYNEGSDFTPANAGTLVDYNVISTNSYTLSGLSGSTTYYAYVRAYIDESTQSTWTGPISFTTLEQYPKPVDLALDSYTGSTATLSWSNGEGTTPTSWQIKYSTTNNFDPNATGTLADAISENPYTLTGLTEGTTYYARVRAYYGDSHYSSWNATQISFTPISAWETFDSGIPDTWYNSGFVTNRSGYEGQAFTSNSSNVLRTPRLYAEKDQTLSYYVTIGGSGSSYKITAQYSTDRINWEDVESAYTTTGTKTFTAPSTGYYWLRFVNGYYCSVDNFNGFGPADVTHDMALNTKSISIPSTGTAHGDYTASVVVMELGGSGETVTAELYFDGVKVAESEATAVGANRDQTISMTFTPTEAKTANMYIKVIYNDDTELTTDNKSVTISNTTYILDETGDSHPNISSKVLRVNYTAQNGWNTICMPFALTSAQMDQLFGTGWTAYAINSFENGNLSFKKVTSALVTATPYLVYADNVASVEDEIYFKSISIFSGTTGWSSTNRTQTKGDASFIGTFDPIAAPGMEDKYGVTTAGKLGKGSSSASIKGYRAYIEVSDPSARLSLVIDGDGDTPTDLGFVRMIDKDATEVYNLQGQKVKKSGKGIYIVNGKKVIVK
jgi:hypothetical protein